MRRLQGAGPFGGNTIKTSVNGDLRSCVYSEPRHAGRKIDRKMIRRGTGFARFSPNEAGQWVGFGAA